MADVPTPSVTGAPLHQTPDSPSTIEPHNDRPTTTNPTVTNCNCCDLGINLVIEILPNLWEFGDNQTTFEKNIWPDSELRQPVTWKMSCLVVFKEHGGNQRILPSGSRQLYIQSFSRLIAHYFAYDCGPSSLPLNVDSEDGETHERGNSNPTSQPSIVLRLSETEIASLPHDPGLRKRISDYHPNDKEIVQREYIRRGPCQPKDYDFPQKLMSKSERKFKAEWFKNFESWLEYSQAKDVAFCFVCYLFKKDNAVGGDAFVSNGFKTWSRTDAFNNHVGNHKSTHNNAMRDLDNFMKQKYSIVSRFENHSTATKSAYLTRLEASIKTTRFLLLQGLSFRGHDEKETSLNRGNFIELLKLLAQHDQNIAKVVLENAPKNCILTSSKIQKQIVNACAMETTMKIVKELDGDFFGILADESVI
ncbi:uncharacterized protein LOC141608225 [Silene latifolia]|uniref:uncharacterized protein LOC141608225 n=1 Tax=Silene latifolia TaxID=37657 RepID=UPI003D78688C